MRRKLSRTPTSSSTNRIRIPRLPTLRAAVQDPIGRPGLTVERNRLRSIPYRPITGS
jgi:hypothetical protein